SSTRITTSSTTPPTMSATMAGVSMAGAARAARGRAALHGRLELEVGLAHQDDIVVDERVLGDAAVVDHAAVHRPLVLEHEAIGRGGDQRVLGRHEAVVDDDVSAATGADDGHRAELEGLELVGTVERHQPADHGP